MRHDVFDQWLTENRNVEFVINNLSDANFDPELFKHYESDILHAYQLTLTQIKA
jgi:hypothetical protein